MGCAGHMRCERWVLGKPRASLRPVWGSQETEADQLLPPAVSPDPLSTKPDVTPAGRRKNLKGLYTFPEPAIKGAFGAERQ